MRYANDIIGESGGKTRDDYWNYFDIILNGELEAPNYEP